MAIRAAVGAATLMEAGIPPRALLADENVVGLQFIVNRYLRCLRSALETEYEWWTQRN